jgi:hypothetical protein
MSKEYGYIGKEVEQAFRDNKGIFTPQDIIELDQENKWTNFGQLELIETQTISSASSAIFTSIQESTYNVHFLTIIDFQPATDGTDCRIRFFESGVEESASVYKVAYNFNSQSNVTGEVKSTGQDRLRGTFNVGNASNEAGNYYSYFYNLGDSTKYSFQTMHGSHIANTGELSIAFGSGVLPQTSTVDQIKIYNASGNFSCTASLYGIRFS